jgi:hypothetical protein
MYYGGFYSPYLWLYGDSGARDEARAARSTADDARDRMDRCALFLTALWSLAKDKLGVTDEELMKRMHDLDLSDGRLDGKIHESAKECPQCHRLMAPRHARCIYCGHVREGMPTL